MKRLWKDQRGVLWTYIMIVLVIMLGGALWFLFFSAVVPIQSAISDSMNAYANDTTTSTWQLADTFMYNIWYYFLILMLLGLLVWVLYESQRKGVQIP